ncbi:PQQ-dependent sugar dehydrogenase [Phenylobacterium sp.]|uniref:PQQ-dependent sugar dehydrogenase n=1 Tax=Phenylobacterium sp. TaxID=1871053 RepID=UPI00122ACED4|nr:PQQ-dependent sugar dehydrogenase [Phenylobacterium sp.]THD64776.1 MAG: PQQ-dependent sugar dehydrogenase [Phenylobacterium sp.]
MFIDLRAARAMTGLALALSLTPGAGAWSQPAAAAAAAFAPGPDYAGVAGSAAENARITGLCGANRNAKDGYAPTPARPDQTHAPQVKSKAPFKVEVLATLDRSVGIAFLPDGKLLLSQRSGGLRTVDAKGQVSEPLAGTPAIAGVMGTSNTGPVLDRDFARNRIVYYGYTAAPPAKGEPFVGKILKARLSADERSLEDAKTIYEAPWLTPRRLVQAKDGTLLIASGEVASGGPNPQSMTDPRGKILRIAADGSIPKDNPYLKIAGANPALYAVGFRDIQGADLDPATGELWVAENEPMGGDELNRIKSGGNYGFPLISYGRQNSGALINDGKTAQAGLEQPVYYWTPSIAPSGMAFYTGKAFPAWKGDVFVGAMSGQQLVRLELKGGRVVGEEKLLMDRCKRTKDVRQGPDGLVYVLTDESPSEILRLAPAR